MSRTSVTGPLVGLTLDPDASEPIYHQVAAQLREAIRSGRIAEGARLPSSRVFASDLGVSRNTILHVFDILRAEGLLQARVGAGTVVALASFTSVEPVSDVPAILPGGIAPVRRLSARGRGVVASATGEFAERPTAFMPDLPDLRKFPIRTWMRLLNETSGRLTGAILADTTNAGYEPLRRAIAETLNASRGMRCSFHQVIVTTGTQQSLDLICRLLLDPGDVVWMEEPGFGGARAVIGANGGRIEPVPVDDDGLRVEAAGGADPRLILTSPSRHYPLGPTLTLARRHALINRARSAGAWIVEDDYDQEFRYAGIALPAIHGLDREGRTIYLGTFSKTLLPSFRLGYLVVPKGFETAFATARAIVDRHASLIEQMVLSEFMMRGLFAAHVRRMRKLYRSRQTQVLEGLAAIFGVHPSVGPTETGMHLALRLQEGVDDRALARTAAERGLVLRPLSPYYAGADSCPGLLVGFSAFDETEIAKGLARLEGMRDRIIPALAMPRSDAGGGVSHHQTYLKPPLPP